MYLTFIFYPIIHLHFIESHIYVLSFIAQIGIVEYSVENATSIPHSPMVKTTTFVLGVDWYTDTTTGKHVYKSWC